MSDPHELMKPEDRLCLWCKHMKSESAFAYSEMTWESGRTECAKNHWNQTIYSDTPLDEPLQLVELLPIAKTCPDFELRNEIKSYLEAKYV